MLARTPPTYAVYHRRSPSRKILETILRMGTCFLIAIFGTGFAWDQMNKMEANGSGTSLVYLSAAGTIIIIGLLGAFSLGRLVHHGVPSDDDDLKKRCFTGLALTLMLLTAAALTSFRVGQGWMATGDTDLLYLGNGWAAALATGAMAYQLYLAWRIQKSWKQSLPKALPPGP